jgi:hypothetical protein
MNIELFKQLIHDQDEGPPELERVIQHIGAERFGGMASANILKILNHAARCTEYHEVYLELGTYNGLTLCGAMADNLLRCDFYAVDNFSQYGGNRKIIEENVDYVLGGLYTRDYIFWEMSIKEFSQDILLPAKVGTVFFDAEHDLYGIIHEFALVKHLLAEHVLLIFDDAAPKDRDLPEWVGEVWRATELLLDLFPGNLSEIAYFGPPNDPGWHLGLRLFEYHATH